MKKDRVMKRLAAALICLLVVNTVLSVFPPYPLAASALAAEESSPQMPVATPSQEIYDEDEQPLFLEDDLATDSEASPSEATPSETSKHIVSVELPDLATLDAGEADQDTWRELLPRQGSAKTASEVGVQCDLRWSVPYVKWDQPGVYSAQVEMIPPDGYTIKESVRYHNAVVSIHPPGTCQVIEVLTRMRINYRFIQGHTWTFAMKVGQDMTPLVETLENITLFFGIIDYDAAEVCFTAEWDFSSVDPTRPGIYPIYRSLTLVEESLPDGISPEDVYLPEYWRNMPVLLSVEEPGGPQLYGTVESPYNFFGSYARLSEDELSALEVFYSINGGEWIHQTDEGLMETDERNFYIEKDAMDEDTSYSFYLKLGNHISQILTVKKDETSPVWFIGMADTNRDGTIEVEFPSISQPPPTDPSEGETDPLPTEPTGGETNPPPTDPTGGETNPPPTDPTGGETNPPSDHGSSDDSERPDSGSSGNGSWDRPGQMNEAKPTGISQPSITSAPGGGATPPVGASDPGKKGAQVASDPEKDGAQVASDPEQDDAQAASDPEKDGAQAAAVRENGSAPKAQPERYRTGSQENRPTEGSRPVPEEVVTRWTTQISGKRAQKLIELYPDWILFQKEEVSVLLSSQWLKDQQMRDSDVLTVSVSPEEDHTVTILINQKEPETPPVCRITVGEKQEERYSGVAATAIFFLGMAGAIAAFMWRRRWRA